MADRADSPAKRVFDVSHPDKSVPTGDSKPSIISNHPVMKEPMAAPSPEVEEPAPQDTAVKMPTKITLQPIHADVVPDTPSSFDKPVEPAVASPPVDNIATTTSERALDERDEFNEQPITPESDAKLLELDSAADDAKRASLDALIVSRKYFLRINTAEKLRTKRALAVGSVLAVPLGLAWLNIALDAGLITLGNLHALTNFF